MPGQSDTELSEFRGWTLRLRAAEGPATRPLLLIHGWTGDENSMWVFARHLPPNYWIVAPRAPHPTKPSGFSWRVGNPAPGQMPDLQDLEPAVERLLSMLDELSAERGMPVTSWNVMGFSQGAVMAAALMLLHPQRVERVALLAGFIARGAEALAADLRLRGKHVFVAHGLLDETVDIELGRQAVRILEAAGARVDVCEDEVGHKVSADCMRRLEGFFT